MPDIHGSQRSNVVIIGVDRLRYQNVLCYGYHRNTTPNICGFAEDAQLFERAYAQATWTPPSVSTLLTSRYPREHGVTRLIHRLPESEVTLAEEL